MSLATIAPPGDCNGSPAEPDFSQLVDAALTAFARDVSYAVSMARAAGVIRHKRAVWAARKQRDGAVTEAPEPVAA